MTDEEAFKDALREARTVLIKVIAKAWEISGLSVDIEEFENLEAINDARNLIKVIDNLLK